MTDNGTPREIPSAAMWAAYMQGETVQLSRFPVRIRRVDPLDLIMSDGSIPGALQAMGDAAGEKAADEMDWAGLAERMPQLEPVLDRVVMAAVVEPTIVEGDFDVDKNEIPLGWLTKTDKLILFGKVFGEMQQLIAGFPGQPGGSVPVTPDGADIRAAARDAAGTDTANQ